MRIDKWLWVVRILKTRSKATTACRLGKITINDITVKPAHPVAPGDVVAVKMPYITRQFKVMGMVEKRVSAKMTFDLVKEITPETELAKLEAIKKDPFSTIFAFREKGLGRPSKRDRRQTAKLKSK